MSKLLSLKVRDEVFLFKKGEASLGADSDALIDQILAIDNRRLRRALGQAPAGRMAEVERSLAILLDLPSSLD